MNRISYILILIIMSFLLMQSCSDEAKPKNAGETQIPVIEAQDNQSSSVKNDKSEASESDRTFQILNKEEKDIIKGKFVYYADVAMFYPCDDIDNPIPVKMNSAYQLLEKSYLNMSGLEPQEKVYIEVKGQLEMLDGIETTRKELTLVIEQLFKMNVNLDCENSAN